MNIDFDQIRELLAIVSQTDISELTLEAGDQKVTVKKAPPAVQAATTIEIPQAQITRSAIAEPVHTETKAPGKAEAVDIGTSNGLVAITSPMVGTFYKSPSPSAPPFVDIGERVSVGQTVCIIEAMKLMNDLPSEVAGKIVKVCVESGTTVEYGQTLFLVDPQN